MVKTTSLKRILPVIILSCAILAGVDEALAADKPLIRASRPIVLDGVREKWRLQWIGSPREVCGPDDPDWMTCPCIGFAFGQAGKTVLVRQIPGKEEERLELAPLFNQDGYDSPADPGEAVFRRWEVLEKDNEKLFRPEFPAEVRKRPLAKLLNFGDYDHDGKASEFLLQVGTLPCGKQMSVAVGVSKKTGRLHVFSSVGQPDRPLLLQAWQWEKLRRAKGAVKVVSRPCGDQGAQEETELELQADNGLIRAVRRQFECGADDKRGKLIKEEPF